MLGGVYGDMAKGTSSFATKLVCPNHSSNVAFLYPAAPSGDDPLTPDDAVEVLEEIVEAQNQSRFLGLKLNVPEYIVTGIHTKYADPKDCLYYVLVEFLKQVEPTITTL